MPRDSLPPAIDTLAADIVRREALIDLLDAHLEYAQAARTALDLDRSFSGTVEDQALVAVGAKSVLGYYLYWRGVAEHAQGEAARICQTKLESHRLQLTPTEAYYVDLLPKLRQAT